MTKGSVRARIATSLVFVFPLLLAYEIGVVFSERMNGVDFLTRALVWVAQGDKEIYLVAHLAVASVYLGAIFLLRGKTKVELGGFLPMLLESSIYALTLGTMIVFVMENLLGFSGAFAAAIDFGRAFEVVVTSLGAGFHEELIFRLIAFAGGTALLVSIGLERSAAIVIGLLVSSLLFSAAHHLGPLGEPFRMGVFVYRALAGVVFALIFHYRSFAHAVYTHFLYDVYVLTLHG